MSVVYKIRIIFANIITILCFIALPAIGHEFWIEPKKYTLVQGDILSASLFVGQDFTGYEMPYIENISLGSRYILKRRSANKWKNW